ncbi:MAG: MbnH family di-heme enzyme [Deinococcota bacterium]
MQSPTLKHISWLFVSAVTLMLLTAFGSQLVSVAQDGILTDGNIATEAASLNFVTTTNLDADTLGIFELDNQDYTWNLPAGFPPPKVFNYNPMTEAKVELGRYLFYDTRLSGNGTMSCSGCHIQAFAFADGRSVPVGSTGEIHSRNSMHLANAVYNGTQTWSNPTLVTLEKQILVPMFGEFPVELGMSGLEDDILERFASDPFYADFFAYAYPDDETPVGIDNIVNALASFVRSMISGSSPYDQFVYGGNREAMSASARLGMNLFLSERLECHHCHGSFNFTQSLNHANLAFAERPFHNTGLYNIDGEGGYPHPNTGLFEHTGDPSDMGKFRAPSLRNVALTAPYFHDGSARSLEEVVSFYENAGRVIEDGEYAGDGRLNPHKDGFVQGFSLNDEERQGLLDFLHALTDESFVTDERYSNPFIPR